jgi:hypothetical protein
VKKFIVIDPTNVHDSLDAAMKSAWPNDLILQVVVLDGYEVTTDYQWLETEQEIKAKIAGARKKFGE